MTQLKIFFAIAIIAIILSKFFKNISLTFLYFAFISYFLGQIFTLLIIKGMKFNYDLWRKSYNRLLHKNKSGNVIFI